MRTLVRLGVPRDACRAAPGACLCLPWTPDDDDEDDDDDEETDKGEHNEAA